MEIFSAIPAVSRDFSLQTLAKRYKSIGFKPEFNNSNGIQKDKLKYVSYSFLNDDEPNAKNINGELVFQELAKTNPLT